MMSIACCQNLLSINLEDTSTHNRSPDNIKVNLKCCWKPRLGTHEGMREPGSSPDSCGSYYMMTTTWGSYHHFHKLPKTLPTNS